MIKQIRQLKQNRINSVKDCNEWYKDNFKAKSNEVIEITQEQFLQNGKFYHFYYTPEDRDSLSYYDSYPLIISLGHTKFKNNHSLDLGLNLNYLPFEVRIFVIEKFYNIFKLQIENNIRLKPFDAKLQKRITDVTYDNLNNIFPKLNLQFAVRNYRREGRYKTGGISYDNLYRLPYIESNLFKKKTVNEIYTIYLKTKTNI